MNELEELEAKARAAVEKQIKEARLMRSQLQGILAAIQTNPDVRLINAADKFLKSQLPTVENDNSPIAGEETAEETKARVISGLTEIIEKLTTTLELVEVPQGDAVVPKTTGPKD